VHSRTCTATAILFSPIVSGSNKKNAAEYSPFFLLLMPHAGYYRSVDSPTMHGGARRRSRRVRVSTRARRTITLRATAESPTADSVASHPLAGLLSLHFRIQHLFYFTFTNHTVFI